MTPKVNILMSTYNGEKYVAEQIKSIQAQTYTDWKLLIRDDGSKDKTTAIIEHFISLDNRIRLVKAENVGVIDSFFALTKMEEADFYFFADQDDVWLPEKISLILEEAKKHDNTRPILYYTDLKIVDQNLKVVSESMIRFQSSHPNTRLHQELTENTVTGGTMAINHALAEKWENTENVIMHDWYLGLVAAALGELIYIDQPTELYRQHSNNVLGARTLTKRMRNWFSRWFMKYWWLIESSQYQAAKILSDPSLTEENRSLITAFVEITDKPASERRKILKQYKLRKNRTLHTLVFRTLITTKFAYKAYQHKGYKK